MGKKNKDNIDKNALKQLDSELGFDNISVEPIKENKSTSLGKVDLGDNNRNIEQIEVQQKFGWNRLSLLDLPSKGKFYKEGTIIRVKSASVREIKYFSTLDENNPLTSSEAVYDLLKSCTQISVNGVGQSYKYIKYIDMLQIIFEIRKLTFSSDKSIISFDCNCDECSTKNTIRIVPENFAKKEYSEFISKYFNNNHFVVSTSSYGNIDLFEPSIGTAIAIKDYITKLYNKDKDTKIVQDKQPFLRILPYLVDDYKRLTFDKINDLEVKFNNFDLKKFTIYSKLIDSLTQEDENLLSIPCTNCSSEITTQIKTDTSLKSLFIDDTTIEDEFI